MKPKTYLPMFLTLCLLLPSLAALADAPHYDAITGAAIIQSAAAPTASTPILAQIPDPAALGLLLLGLPFVLSALRQRKR